MSTHESHHLLPLLYSILVKWEWGCSRLCQWLLPMILSAALTHMHHDQSVPFGPSSCRDRPGRLMYSRARPLHPAEMDDVQPKSPRPTEPALKTLWLQDLTMGVGNSNQTHTWIVQSDAAVVTDCISQPKDNKTSKKFITHITIVINKNYRFGIFHTLTWSQ